ncbi:MAG: hypothetical protein AB7I27_05300 [Bacteriovoracaceae bacterium]
MRHLVVTVFVLIVCSGSYLFLRRNKFQEATLASRKQSAKDIFLSPRVSSNVVVTNTVLANDIDCLQLKESLNNLDFREKNIDLDGLVFSCSNTEVKDALNKAKEKCQKFNDDCRISLIFLRAILRALNLSEATTKEEIADLILKEFSNKNPNFKLLNELAEKLLEFNPSDKSFQQLWAMSKLLSQDDLRNLPENLADEINSRVDSSIWKNGQMKGLEMVLQTGLNSKKMEVFLTEQLRKNSNDSFSHELMGFALWKQNRREEAIQALDRAIHLNENDLWLKNMRKTLMDQNATIESYQGRLSLGVNLDDLFNE